MTADAAVKPLAYKSGDPNIDAAVRFWLPTLPPLTPAARALLTDMFNRKTTPP